MAKQTVSALSILTLFREETPIDWNSSGVTHNCFDHAPKQKNEKYMKDDKQYYVGTGLKI